MPGRTSNKVKLSSQLWSQGHSLLIETPVRFPSGTKDSGPGLASTDPGRHPSGERQKRGSGLAVKKPQLSVHLPCDLGQVIFLSELKCIYLYQGGGGGGGEGQGGGKQVGELNDNHPLT